MAFHGGVLSGSASAPPPKPGAAARGGGVIPAGKGGSLRSPGKPVVLADITNTGRPNPTGSVHAIADVLKVISVLALFFFSSGDFGSNSNKQTTLAAPS